MRCLFVLKYLYGEEKIKKERPQKGEGKKRPATISKDKKNDRRYGVCASFGGCRFGVF